VFVTFQVGRHGSSPEIVISTLKKEVLGSSEMLVRLYQTTERHMSGDPRFKSWYMQ